MNNISNEYDELRDDRGIYLYQNNDPNDLIDKLCSLEKTILMLWENENDEQVQDAFEEAVLDYRMWKRENETQT